MDGVREEQEGEVKLPNEKQFLADVKDHAMDVRRDDGIYRNIRFQKPERINHYFDVTTWPGMLCISGDMGCYVFSRVTDMFKFFRGVRPYIRGDKTLGINLGYWHEKVRAECATDGCEEYDPSEFKRIINRIIYSGGWPKAVRDEVKDQVLTYAEEDEHAAKRAAYEFSCTHDGKRYEFQDLWGYGNCKRYTYRFVWCCYAIVWAIQTYDRHKAAQVGNVA